LGLGLAVIGFALLVLGFGAGTQRAQVPWVLGKSEAQAIKRIERHDLRAEILDRSDGAHRLERRFKDYGEVVFQDYRGGITLPRGATVRLMVYPRSSARDSADRD
jgi:beta-lactam-binding protein with PASTA domain